MGQRGTLALLAQMALQVLQVRLVQQGLREPQALQELLVLQVQPVLPVPLVRMGQRELQAPRALLGLPVLLVQMELQVPMGPRVPWVRLVQQGPRVLQVKQVP
jgi:hypothetical protein